MSRRAWPPFSWKERWSHQPTRAVPPQVRTLLRDARLLVQGQPWVAHQLLFSTEPFFQGLPSAEWAHRDFWPERAAEVLEGRPYQGSTLRQAGECYHGAAVSLSAEESWEAFHESGYLLGPIVLAHDGFDFSPVVDRLLDALAADWPRFVGLGAFDLTVELCVPAGAMVVRTWGMDTPQVDVIGTLAVVEQLAIEHGIA